MHGSSELRRRRTVAEEFGLLCVFGRKGRDERVKRERKKREEKIDGLKNLNLG